MFEHTHFKCKKENSNSNTDRQSGSLLFYFQLIFPILYEVIFNLVELDLSFLY